METPNSGNIFIFITCVSSITAEISAETFIFAKCLVMAHSIAHIFKPLHLPYLISLVLILCYLVFIFKLKLYMYVFISDHINAVQSLTYRFQDFQVISIGSWKYE